MTGRLFRNRNRPRVSLDFKVGSSHMVEVLLHLRRQDWDWYQSNASTFEEELLNLLEESILPRIFEEEVEGYHRKHSPQIFPPEKIGAKNKTLKKSNETKTSKRSRKGGKNHVTIQKQVEIMEEDKMVKRDVYYAFGEILQLAFRKKELPSWTDVGRTIFYKEVEEEGAFYDRPKLSSRLFVWCSQINPQNKTNPDPDNVGFFREEMIPISSLFREPKEL